VNPVEQAELAILGLALSTSGAVLDDIVLAPRDFYEPAHADLFETIQSEWAEGRPVDAFTLSEASPDQTAFLFGLTSTPASPSSAPYYADIIRKHALRRRLSAAGAGLSAIDPGVDEGELADRARQLVEQAIGSTAAKIRYVKDVIPDVLARMDSEEVFVPSPWKSLNAAIGGFRPGAVYVIAARPGVGKTVIAAQIAARLAEEGHVAFSSLEMTGEELVARLISERLRISVGHIKDAKMTDHDWATFHTGRERLDRLNIAIDDRSGIAPSDVRTFARAVARNGKLSGIVIDYMQLMTSKQRMDRHLQVAEFSRQLKILAKDLQVPVIALSQLNRNSEATALAVPKLSDLRESGAIEQDADAVFLLRKEGDTEDDGYNNVRLIIDVAKNRHGRTGEIQLRWDGGYSRAVEWDHTDRQEGNQ
jgi:replicative DNA helicase